MVIQRLIFISFLLFIGSIPVQAAAAVQDMRPTHWAAENIEFLLEQNIWQLEEGRFVRPNDLATRGETIELLARALKLPATQGEALVVQDVQPGQRYYEEMKQLIHYGIITNQQYFQPDHYLKRDQVAKMLALAFKIEVDPVHKRQFYDISQKHWARDYILTLADLDIVNGKGNNRFVPNDFVTRAQLAKMLTGILQFKKAEQQHEVIYDYLSKHYIETKNDYVQWEQEAIRLINDIRVKHKLMPLTHDPALTQLAIIKAQNMLDMQYFDHYSPLYSDPWDLAFVFDYHFLAFGENIARHFTTPKQTIDAWMASPGHRANILKNNYTYIGIGVKKHKNNSLYIVNHFANK